MSSQHPPSSTSTGKQPAYRRVNIACRLCRGRKVRCETPGDGQPCRKCIETGKECVYEPVAPPHPGPQQDNFIPMSPHDLSRGPSQQPGVYSVESRADNPPSPVVVHSISPIDLRLQDYAQTPNSFSPPFLPQHPHPHPVPYHPPPGPPPHPAQSNPGYNQPQTFPSYSHPGGAQHPFGSHPGYYQAGPSQPAHLHHGHPASGSQTSQPHGYSLVTHGGNPPAGPSLGRFPPPPGPPGVNPPTTAGDFFPHNPQYPHYRPSGSQGGDASRR